MGSRKPFYSIRQAADGESDHAEILIYSEIGESWWTESVAAKDFVRELQELDVKTIALRINSPGGAVFDGHAILNALKRHPAQVTTYIDGWAASIASIIALAGERIVIADNAMLMIHNPHGWCEGEAGDMRKYADLLDQLQRSSAELYVGKCGKPLEDVVAKMDAETWFTAEEAVEYGLADEITADGGPAERAQFGHEAVARFRRVPGHLLAQLAHPAEATPDDEGFCGAPSVPQDDAEQRAQRERLNRMLFS